MLDSIVLTVRIAYADDTKRSISWSGPDLAWPAYEVDVDILKSKAQELRNCLNDFVRQSLTPHGIENCGTNLKSVAKAGYDLYLTLFHNAGDGYDPDPIAEWLRDHPECRITFLVIDRMYIPWGLIYDQDPSKLSGNREDVKLDSYKDFWCIKYKVSSVYKRNLKPLPSMNLQGIAVLNKVVYDRVKKCLEQDKTISKLLTWFESTFAPFIYGSTPLIEQWKTNGNNVNILFFYCHADGTTLVLDPTDSLSMEDFTLKLKKKASAGNDPSSCLVFLNGCSTATGHEKGGFLEATGNTGFCGFIGTESTVPDIFAMRFSLAFLYEMAHSGHPVYQVMDELRRKHWPLSLVYSVYCYPPLCVTKNAKLSAEEITFDNFSRLQLGSQDEALI